MPTPRVHPDRQMTSAERSRRFREAVAAEQNNMLAEHSRFKAALERIASGPHYGFECREIAQQALSPTRQEGE